MEPPHSRTRSKSRDGPPDSTRARKRIPELGMRAAILATLAMAGCACQTQRPDPVREYIRLSVALGERDSQSLDYYYGPAEWVSDVKKQPPPFAEIAKQLSNCCPMPKETFCKGRSELWQPAPACSQERERPSTKRRRYFSISRDYRSLMNISPMKRARTSRSYCLGAALSPSVTTRLKGD